MVNNLILSFNVVLPLFLCMALGYFLRRIKMYDESALQCMNKICFKVFLPILLFRNIYTTDLSGAMNGKLLLLALLFVVCWFVFLMLMIPLIEKENAKKGVLVQGIFRSNFVLFGLPVATALCGEENVGVTSLLIGVVVPLFNILAVISLEYFRGGRPSIRQMVRGIITNPLILASALGVLFYFLRIRLPEALETTVRDLARVATPLSLLVLGGFFTFSAIPGYRKQLCIGIIGKLVLAPLLLIPIGIAMGFRGAELVTLLTLSGSPTAVSSFTMAQQMDGDAELAAEVVVFTTAFSILTIFLWVFLLKTLQMI